MILMPLYWQEVRHESVIDTGLLVPAGSRRGAGDAARRQGLDRSRRRRAARAPRRRSDDVATIPFGLIGAHTSVTWLCVAMFVRGMGIGFAFMPAMTAAFAALERSRARRRDSTVERAAACGRLARDGSTRGRAPAGARRRPHRRPEQRPRTARRSGRRSALTAIASCPAFSCCAPNVRPVRRSESRCP